MTRQTPRDAPPAEEAAYWVVRLDAGPLSRRETRAFAAWLAADPAHAAAYDRLAAILLPPTPVRMPPRRPRRRVGSVTGTRPRLALAASAAAATLAVLIPAGDALRLRWQADAITGIGERRLIHLPDGSQAWLAPQSALAWHMHADRRDLRLLRGTAAFAVRRDPARPFAVASGDGQAIARGTAFIVRRDAGATQVDVLQHRVEVRTGRGGTSLREGWQVRYSADGLLAPDRRFDRDSVVALLRGRLIADDQPLGDVIAALQPYRHGRILLSPHAARRRVDGVYDLDRPEAALALIASSLGLHRLDLGGVTILYAG